MTEYFLTINGKAVKSPTTFGVINPATEEVFAQAPECTVEQLGEAVAAAKAAFKTWQHVPLADRKQYLLKIADAIDAKAGEFAHVLVQEQGKSLANAKGETMFAAMIFRNAAQVDLPVTVVAEDEKHRCEVRRKPLGVVVGITPWNFPLLICAQKIAPAIVCGNTVIVKPSPFTPLTSLMLGQLVNEILPPGVASVLSGGNDVGAKLVAHPDVAKVTFTGSVATGQKIQAVCAEHVKRVTLELGGNDAGIVLSDVDPAKVAKNIFAGAFANTGQVCCAIKRLFVPEERYDEWVAALAEECTRHKFGNGLEEGVEYGPLNNKMQFDRISALVADAKANGATIVCGGAPLGGKGYFYPPTIIRDATDSTRIVAEEQFGPALPVLKYSTVEEAIDRANHTQFGLGGSVWSNDVDKATQIAAQLDVGTSWVNEHIAVNGFLSPFGGRKFSGIGREGGSWGFDAYTEACTISIAKTL